MFRCIALDAMGVIFEAADDVAELLVPFVKAANPAATPAGSLCESKRNR